MRGGSLFPHKKLQGHAVQTKAQVADLVDPQLVEEQEMMGIAETLDLDEDVEDPLLPATSKAQMASAAKKNSCYVCSDESHFVRDCPYVKAIKQLKAQEGSTKAKSGPPSKPEGEATHHSARANPQ